MRPVIDPDRLDPDAREVWDVMFPDGFWVGISPEEGPRFRLWSYAYVCEVLELGYVPDVVDEVLTPEAYEAIGGYWRSMSERRERGEPPWSRP